MNADSVLTILMMDIPGHQHPQQVDFDAILGNTHGIEPGYRALYDAAAVRSLIHHGLFYEAADMSLREACPQIENDRSRMTTPQLAASYAILAMAQLLSGDIHQAASFINTARTYAHELNDRSFLFWCMCLQAAAMAVDGESTRAAGLVHEAGELENDIHTNHDSWPLDLARLYIRAQRAWGSHPEIDAELMADRETPPSSTVHGDSWQRVIRTLNHGIELERNGNFDDAVDIVSAMTFGLDADGTPPLIDETAWYLLIVLLIHTNNLIDATIALQTKQSRSNSAIGFDLLRAMVCCKTGNFSSAIATANACLKTSYTRSMTAPITAILIRAMVFELMDDHETALVEFKRVCHMAANLGNAIPTLGMPIDPLRRLVLSSGYADTPQGHRVVQRIQNRKNVKTIDPCSYSRLTQRQIEVAQLLLTNMTLSQIADRMFISINTVKTQVKTIYKKLNVSSRMNAVRVLTSQPWLLTGDADLHHTTTK